MSKERGLLESCLDEMQYHEVPCPELVIKIKELLAQPEQKQEPVAWHYIYDDGITVRERVTEYMPLGEHYTVTPLYASPKRDPLTDENVCEILLKKEWKGFVDLVRIIEKAHGIGD